MNLCWQHAFTCICSGPTQSGKTSFVKKLIQNRTAMISPTPYKVWYCYAENQTGYNELKQDPHVTFINGVLDLSLLRSSQNEPQLIILDDLMDELKRDSRLVQLFTRGCHHWNMSAIHIVQNLFYEGLRTSRINAQYLVLMKNPSDQSQILNLGKQLFPGKHKYFIESYNDATNEPHGYLLVDLTQSTPDSYRLRTNIFPNETQYIYASKF